MPVVADTIQPAEPPVKTGDFRKKPHPVCVGALLAAPAFDVPPGL